MPSNYLALADALEAAITQETPGTRLPSEHALSSAHAVSRVTARSALQELERRHLVRRARGSGTFTALRLPYPIRGGTSPSWSQIVLDAGHVPTYDFLTIQECAADEATTRALSMRPGSPVVHIERVGLVDGQVATRQSMRFDSTVFGAAVPEQVYQLLTEQPSTTSLLADHFGVKLERWATRAELQPISIEAGADLQLTGRPMAWRTETVNRCRRTLRPVEHTTAWLRADNFHVFLHVGPADGPPPFASPVPVNPIEIEMFS